MNRLLAVALVLALSVTACGNDDDGNDGSASDDAPATTLRSPTADPGCQENPGFPRRIALPSDVTLFVTACDAANGLSARIQNESAFVLYIGVEDPRRTTWLPVMSPNDLMATAVRGATPSGKDLHGGYRLLPRSAVVLSSPLEPIISLSFPIQESASAVAGAYIGEWLQQYVRDPRPPFLVSLNTCVTETSRALQSSSFGWQESIRSAIRGVPACNSVVKAARGVLDQPTLVESADDIVRQRSKFAGFWDNVVSLAGRISKVTPRA